MIEVPGREDRGRMIRPKLAAYPKRTIAIPQEYVNHPAIRRGTGHSKIQLVVAIEITQHDIAPRPR